MIVEDRRSSREWDVIPMLPETLPVEASESEIDAEAAQSDTRRMLLAEPWQSLASVMPLNPGRVLALI
jgi:hypothetical protein